MTMVHAHIPGLVDAWREFPVPVRDYYLACSRYTFMRPEDLPRARAVWESTVQTNLRKSMYEALDKAMKTIGSRDHTHPEKNVHTSGSVSYATHSQKLEAYDRTMADCYAEGTTQPDLDPEACVDAAGGPRKGRVYGFGDSLDTTPVLSSYASSVAPPAYASSSATPPGSAVEEMRTLIREELRTHFGIMVE
ncbi:hypothetical protein Taro_008916 [Colocasia esculenta]|uniref:Uncharacterized protein n=1 Tax=Colocasia esculenta TaxID=4460 RepID=A0A843U8J1_COLES|nr:hypothetical protein [Colocasia esculenta]